MIYLVRHGEAAARWGRADADPDPGLSDLGRTQAALAARALVQRPVERLIASPMRRAQETAAAFAAASGLPIETRPEVSEIPRPDGLSDPATWLKGVLAGRWADQSDALRNWRNSVFEFVAALPDETVVFSHFVPINAVVGLIEGREEAVVFHPNYASITILERAGGSLCVSTRGGEADTLIL